VKIRSETRPLWCLHAPSLYKAFLFGLIISTPPRGIRTAVAHEGSTQDGRCPVQEDSTAEKLLPAYDDNIFSICLNFRYCIIGTS
jgi:hypothetical protein